MRVCRRERELVRSKLLLLERRAEQASLLLGAQAPAVRVQVGARWAVLAWPGERWVVWEDTRKLL